MNIEQWLRGLGLQSYEQVFRDHGVDFDVLPRLTADDLKEMGISAIGHRLKILEAIGKLKVASAATTLTVGRHAERRQLTVMFCDLVASTALSRQLDPEDLRDLLRAYHAQVRHVVTAYGGFIAKYMGDGVLAYFGWPNAHEDDSKRAVRSGLALTESVARLRTPANEQLEARVGIAYRRRREYRVHGIRHVPRDPACSASASFWSSNS